MSISKMLSDAKARCLEIADEMQSVADAASAEGRALNDADQAIVAALSEEHAEKEKEIKSLSSMHEAHEKIVARRDTNIALNPKNPDGPVFDNSQVARIKRTRSKVYEDTAEAFACGQWLAAVIGNRQAQNWCKDRGLDIRNAMEEGTTTLGGFAVPDPMAATIIRLVEEYGVYRRNSRLAVMSSDTLAVPRRSAGTTVYWPDEGTAITASDLTFAQVNLTAKKAAQLSIMSTELNEDAVINMIDLITTEMAWNFALSEDTAGFLGDGTDPGGMTGIESALLDGSKVTVTGAAATAWADLSLDDLNAMVGLCPTYGSQQKWYVNSYGYHVGMLPLLQALGGTSQPQVEASGGMSLLGYPVEFTQVLPGVTVGVDKLMAVFGDLNGGSYFGDRRRVTIKTLNELYAANDQIGVVATERYDVNVFDVGTADDPGCIIGLFAPAA